MGPKFVESALEQVTENSLTAGGNGGAIERARCQMEFPFKSRDLRACHSDRCLERLWMAGWNCINRIGAGPFHENRGPNPSAIQFSVSQVSSAGLDRLNIGLDCLNIQRRRSPGRYSSSPGRYSSSPGRYSSSPGQHSKLATPRTESHWELDPYSRRKGQHQSYW